MFKWPWLNNAVLYLVAGVACVFGLTCLWNFVMPTLGVAKITMLQFAALFILVHSFKIKLVKINLPKKEDKKPGAVK